MTERPSLAPRRLTLHPCTLTDTADVHRLVAAFEIDR